MGKLRYHGLHVYYHFQDQYGTQQKLSLKLKVDKIRKDPRGNEIFPSEAHELKKKIDREVFDRVWGLNLETKSERVKLEDAFKSFIKPYENESTIQAYTNAYDKLFSFFGNVDVDTITEDMMLDWRKGLFEKYPNKVSVENFVRHARGFFNYLEEARIIDRTPMTRRVKMKPVDTPIVIFADPDLEKFWTSIKEANEDAYNQLYFLLLVGWRVSDSCRLTWDKIDFDRGVILHYIGKPGVVWEYPMDKELSEFLEKLPRTSSPYVFFYRVYSSLGHEFRYHCDKKDKETKQFIIRNARDLSVHTLRKQFTYNCFRRGVPLEVCSKLLGHSSVKTTEKYYLYWDTQMLRDALTLSRQATGKLQETSKKRKKKKAV